MNILRLCLLVMALTGLDLTGSVLLKEASAQRSPMLMLAGVGCFVGLAGLLYLALEQAELTVVSLTWIVLYQAGAMTADALLYDVIPTRLQCVAVVVALAALTVAIGAPSRAAQVEASARHNISVPIPRPRPQSLLPSQQWPTLEMRLLAYAQGEREIEALQQEERRLKRLVRRRRP